MAALGTILTVTAPREMYIWFYVLWVAIPIALAYATIVTLFSNQVDADSQGWIMGITGAIMAFAFGLNGMLIGLLTNIAPYTPLIVAAFCLIVAAILMKLIFKET